jgi:hypothetical protein
MSGKFQIALILVVAVFLLMDSVDAKDRRTQKRNGTRTPKKPKANDKGKEQGTNAGKDNKTDGKKENGTQTPKKPKANDKDDATNPGTDNQTGGKKDDGGKDNGGKDNGGKDNGGSKCVDEAKNCKDLHSHCTDKPFDASLKKHCAMTCGHCAPPKDQCKDVAGGQCAQMKQKGFCGSSAHPVNMQRMYCAKTCDLCAK